jgi:spermidine synthase
MWSFQYGLKGNVYASQELDSASVEAFVQSEGLRYYNSALHTGSFALPNFVKSLLLK